MLHELVNIEEAHDLGLPNLDLLRGIILFVFAGSDHDRAPLQVALDQFASQGLIDHDHVSDVEDLFEGDHDLTNCDLVLVCRACFSSQQLTARVTVADIGQVDACWSVPTRVVVMVTAVPIRN